MRNLKVPEVVTFRVDATTKAMIEGAAKARGVTPGILCRDIVASEIGAVLAQPRVRRAVSNGEELRALLSELSRQGSNLNQISRQLNAGATPASVADDLSTMRASYAAALALVTAAIGVGRDP